MADAKQKRQSFSCELCGVTTFSATLMEQHKAGGPHRLHERAAAGDKAAQARVAQRRAEKENAKRKRAGEDVRDAIDGGPAKPSAAVEPSKGEPASAKRKRGPKKRQDAESCPAVAEAEDGLKQGGEDGKAKKAKWRPTLHVKRKGYRARKRAKQEAEKASAAGA